MHDVDTMMLRNTKLAGNLSVCVQEPFQIPATNACSIQGETQTVLNDLEALASSRLWIWLVLLGPGRRWIYLLWWLCMPMSEAREINKPLGRA